MRKINLICLILGIIHCILAVFYTEPFSSAHHIESQIIYFGSKALSFAVIILLWLSISRFIQAIINKDKKIIDFGKYTLLYFIINIIVLCILFPVPSSHVDVTGQFTKSQIYIFDWWMYFIHNCFCYVFYHIFPAFFGYVASSILLYSFIFGYCIYSAKYYISQKYYKLLMIPFFFPLFLIYNEIPRRNVIGGWIFIFVFMFFIVNNGKKNQSSKLAFFIGLISAILVHYRYEFIILLIFIPLIVYFYKIFDKKRLFVYLSVFITFFASIFFIQKLRIDNIQYERENLPFAIMSLKDNIGYKLTDEDIEVLSKVSPNPERVMINETANPKDLERANKQMKKIIIKHIFPLIIANAKHYKTEFNINDFFRLKGSSIREYYPRPESNYFEKEFYSHYKKEKLVSKIIYLTDDFTSSNFTKFFCSMDLNFAILIIMFIVGLITKKTIYSVYSVIWFGVISIILAILYSTSFIYVYPFLLNSWVLFFVMLTDLLSIEKK